MPMHLSTPQLQVQVARCSAGWYSTVMPLTLPTLPSRYFFTQRPCSKKGGQEAWRED